MTNDEWIQCLRVVVWSLLLPRPWIPNRIVHTFHTSANTTEHLIKPSTGLSQKHSHVAQTTKWSKTLTKVNSLYKKGGGHEEAQTHTKSSGLCGKFNVVATVRNEGLMTAICLKTRSLQKKQLQVMNACFWASQPIRHNSYYKNLIHYVLVSQLCSDILYGP